MEKEEKEEEEDEEKGRREGGGGEGRRVGGGGGQAQALSLSGHWSTDHVAEGEVVLQDASWVM